MTASFMITVNPDSLQCLTGCSSLQHVTWIMARALFLICLQRKGAARTLRQKCDGCWNGQVLHVNPKETTNARLSFLGHLDQIIYFDYTKNTVYFYVFFTESFHLDFPSKTCQSSVQKLKEYSWIDVIKCKMKERSSWPQNLKLKTTAADIFGIMYFKLSVHRFKGKTDLITDI